MRTRIHFPTNLTKLSTKLDRLESRGPARSLKRSFGRWTTPMFLAASLGALAGCGGGGAGGSGGPGEETPAPPAAPVGVVLHPGTRAMHIAWDAVPGAEAYAVYVSTSPSVDDRNYGRLPDGLHIPAIADTAVRVDGLLDGATYFARVAAQNRAGVGPLSALASATLVPGLPPDVRAVSGVASMHVEWAATLGAKSYDVYLSTAVNIDDKNFGQLPDGRHIPAITGTNVQIDDLRDGTLYFVRVAAKNDAGVGPLCTPVHVILLPGVPADVAAVGGIRSMRVSWSMSVGARAYDVYVSTAPDVDETNFEQRPDGQHIAGIAGDTVQIDGLRAGEKYFARVAAANEAGSSALAARVEATLVPGIPTNVVAVGGVGSMLISWDLMLGAASYDVYVSTAEEVDDHNFGQLPDGQHIAAITDTMLQLDGLREGATYFARISAKNDAGVEALGAPVHATLAPGIPMDVKALAGVGSLRASWAATLGAMAYDVYLGKDAAISSENWETIAGGARIPDLVPGSDIPNLENGIEYWFVVVARNDAGHGGDSAAAKAKPSARGTFAVAGSLTAGASVSAGISVDLDGDGKLDLVMLDGPNTKLTVFPGLGDGTFGASFELAVGAGPSAVAAADLNGDGALDLVTTDTADGKISVLLGDGLGGFNLPVAYPAGTAPRAIAVVALDSATDAIPDLVITDVATNEVLFLRGVGDGSFEAPLATSVDLNPLSMVVGDWNADGAPDVATANRNSGNATILLGDGLGGFLPRLDVTVGNAPIAIEARDIDADGDLDLVLAMNIDAAVVVLRGQGDGTFVADAPIDVGTAPEGLVSGDFDGDGALDLAVADPVDATLTVLLGDGHGDFREFFVLDLPQGPFSLIVLDFNGDGVLDLAASNHLDGTVTLLVGSGV